MIVDSHVHVEYKENGIKYSPEEYIKAMDESGVDVSIIIGVDQADLGYKRTWANLIKGPLRHDSLGKKQAFMPLVINYEDEEVAEFCKKYPKRFIGVGSIHPDRYRSDLKVKNAIEKLGLRGIKLYPHSGFYPNDKRLDRVYEVCIKNDVPVFIHSGIKALRSQTIKYNNPIYADDVATRFPNLKIVLLHGGFPWTKEYLAVVHSNPNVWADITFLDYIEKTFLEEGLVEETMKKLIKLIGSERILWGSEGPFMYLPMYGKHGPTYIKESQKYLVKRFSFLTELDKNNILGNNAVKLLKIKG